MILKALCNISFLLGYLFFPQTAQAASSAVASVDTNKVALGEALTLTITVETSDSVNVGSPRLPSLDGFNILSRNESVESRSTFTNGQFQYVQKRNFHFALSPIRQGKLTIGSAEVVAGDQTLKTQPITIDVGAPGSGSARKRVAPQQQDPFEEDPFFEDADDLFSQLLKRRGLQAPGGIKTQPVNEDEAFFIQLEVDKDTVYEGEQVTASFYLVTPYSIRDIDTLKYPSLKGFWKEDIEIATRLNFQREIINGVAYNKALLASYALFPLKAGAITVDSYKAKCTVVTQANMLGMGSPYSYTKASQPVKINVKPLPKEKQPQDFSGAVGEFNVAAKIDAAGGRVPVNQPFSLKVRIEGRGNAKVVQLPPLELPPDLEVYDKKEDSKFFRDGTSFKEFELFLIPRKTGKFSIPAISISSFNPAKGQFIQANTSSFDIQVGEGKANENYQSSPLSQLGGNESASQVKRGKELPPPLMNYTVSYRLSPAAWGGVWGGVFVLMMIGLGFKARNELGFGGKQKSLKDKMSLKMKPLREFVSQGDYRKSGAEAINLINLVLGEIAQEGGATSGSFDKLIVSAPPSVRRECEKDLQELVSYFDMLAFAPDSLATQMSSQLKEKVKLLEKVLYKAVDVSTSTEKSK